MSLPKEHSCGECSLCCKVMAIEELQKPANQWCEHTHPGRGGCGIYTDRPPSCQMFQCQWLLDPAFPDRYRPDKVHVFMSSVEADPIPGQTRPPGTLMTFYVDPGYPTAHLEDPVSGWVDTLMSKGYRVCALVGRKAYARLGKKWIVAKTIHHDDRVAGAMSIYI